MYDLDRLKKLLTTMPDDELAATRRDMAVGIGLLRPGSLMYGPAHEYLAALDTELARRGGEQT